MALSFPSRKYECNHNNQYNFSQWNEVLDDLVIASAIVNRLLCYKSIKESPFARLIYADTEESS